MKNRDKATVFAIRMSTKMRARIGTAAVATDRSSSGIVRRAVNEWLDKHGF